MTFWRTDPYLSHPVKVQLARRLRKESTMSPT
jgi:hypothetical protein